jgi:hypothetical protein
MQGKKTVDWSSVDWSKQNRDIAEHFQVSPSIVSVMRKQLRKPQPKLRYNRKNSQARLEQWKEVDWRQTNTAIGRIMNVSGERVRKIRLMLGMPKASTFGTLDPRAVRCLERAKAGLDRVRGCCSQAGSCLFGITGDGDGAAAAAIFVAVAEALNFTKASRPRPLPSGGGP